VHCGTRALYPREEHEARWKQDCRQLPAAFLRDVLVRAPQRDQVPPAGVHIIGATINGDIDLTYATLHRALIIDLCRIEDDVYLDEVRTDNVIYITQSLVAGTFRAVELHSDMSLVLDESEFKGRMTLSGASIANTVSMDGATLDADLNADLMQVGLALFMRTQFGAPATFRGVSLKGARVTGDIEMTGAKFLGDIDADSLEARGLLMGSDEMTPAQFKNVNLGGARVTGMIDLGGATVDGELYAASLQVDTLTLASSRAKSRFKAVTLANAIVARNLGMDGAVIDGDVHADSLNVGDKLFMRHALITHPFSLIWARVGTLDITGATLADLDLSGTSILGELRLGGGTNLPTEWRTKSGGPGTLSLRSTHIGNLMDAKNAWPTNGHLHLDGFALAHLGGFEGDTGIEMRSRGMSWWDSWIRRDPVYDPTPYEQLTTALAVAGDRSAADEIHYLGRVRQRESEKAWLPWIFQGFLQYTAGFGIGNYTFRVLYWVMGISLAGAIYLWLSVPGAKSHGVVWCFGASLNRLLPIIELNKEFEDFFNDPERKRLRAWETLLFSAIALVGWVLGAILIAAVSGLMQKP